MTDRGFERTDAAPNPRAGAESIKNAASEAFGKAADAARQAGSKAKSAASETASTVSEQAKVLLDRQIGSNMRAAGQFAGAVKIAAQDIEGQSPLLAGLVRNVATKVEDYAEDMQDETVEQLTRSASDFTRRQPALVFGLAALAGFALFRALKSAPDTRAPSIQPDVEDMDHEDMDHSKDMDLDDV